MAGETPLRPFPVWILFATLMLTGPVIAGCVFPAASDAFGEALEPEPGAIRGLTPQHLRGHPADLAISPDGRHAFIPMPGTISRPDQRIVVVDLLRGSLVESIDVGRRPLGLTADPSAPERVFVTHAYSPSISVLDTSGRRVHQVLTAPYYLEHLAFTSDGGRLLAVDSAEDRLVVYRVEIGRAHV